ncbi:MAG: hypothetical protein JW715_08505 [Sedimentisphaerales bacterium]|nr:hypothetical protein [Sedimentisphaerales bacterium]
MNEEKQVKKVVIMSFLIILSLLMISTCPAKQAAADYVPLDQENPIVFDGDHIIYKGDKITLGPKAFFIDGQFTDEEAAKYPYVFNSVNHAAEYLTDGTEESPMVLYIAPYVYWIDNPDDPAIRMPENGMSPYGLTIKCEWLRFYGLSDNPENVVLACNRGQTMGSRGNFTMFRFSGQGTSSENITFGNYCNVDLVYPLKPELNREKRGSAIVQAQLIVCDGDKIVARNTRFISRLNLLPFVGGKRTFFDRCHFESTDDALCTTGVYLNCTFDFYSPRPFVATTGTGAVLLNCDIRSFTHGEQYFTKLNGQLGILDTRITSDTVTYVGWKDIPPPETRNYQYNVSFNAEPFFIGKNNPASTVDMTGKPILNAYRFTYKGKVIYNTYNLLCGEDDWDPMGIKDIVLAAEKENGKKYTMLPVQLLIVPTGPSAKKESANMVTTAIRTRLQVNPIRVTIETKKDDIRLTTKTYRFGNCEFKEESIKWNLAPEYKSLVEMKVSEDGTTCDIIPTNTHNETRQVIVTASSPSGLEAATVLNVAPAKLDAPKFSSPPKISSVQNGKLSVDYKLDMKFEDQSLVSWYRCTDAKGSNPIEVAVSRLNIPMLEYELSAGDIGYYIMVSVAPKHIRCDAGEPVVAVAKNPITAKDVKADSKVLHTDFRNISTKNQPEIIPGFWTFQDFTPSFTSRSGTMNTARDAWYYGEGKDGAINMTGLLQGRNARMFYTPIGESFSDMKLSMTVAPYKTAGQGFSIAHLYMDVLIKFDPKTLTGYGLRFIRTTKYHNTVDCMFVKYENGEITEISDPVSTTCYRPTCNITVEVKGNKIIAHAETPSEYNKLPNMTEVVPEVNIETDITPNDFGGFGIQYTGGSPTMIKELKIEWK